MSDDAKGTMLLCQDLAPDEQEKVERLDAAISAQFNGAGQVVRLCRGRIAGEQRMLDFCRDPLGMEVVATVSASEFVDASDADSLAMIMP